VPAKVVNRLSKLRAAGLYPEFGCEVHRNIGKTGLVGVLRTGNGPSIGLRADIDALPLHEANDIPYRSKHDGIMHACGHDGHTMLLDASRYLAETRNFAASIVRIHFDQGDYCIPETPPGTNRRSPPE
jgi:hippurate hydrolase